MIDYAVCTTLRGSVVNWGRSQWCLWVSCGRCWRRISWACAFQKCTASVRNSGSKNTTIGATRRHCQIQSFEDRNDHVARLTAKGTCSIANMLIEFMQWIIANVFKCELDVQTWLGRSNVGWTFKHELDVKMWVGCSNVTWTFKCEWDSQKWVEPSNMSWTFKYEFELQMWLIITLIGVSMWGWLQNWCSCVWCSNLSLTIKWKSSLGTVSPPHKRDNRGTHYVDVVLFQHEDIFCHLAFENVKRFSSFDQWLGVNITCQPFGNLYCGRQAFVLPW